MIKIVLITIWSNLNLKNIKLTTYHRVQNNLYEKAGFLLVLGGGSVVVSVLSVLCVYPSSVYCTVCSAFRSYVLRYVHSYRSLLRAALRAADCR